MGEERPFAAPGITRLISVMFQDFCKAQGFTVLSSAVDKYGSWEWSAGNSDLLHRSISFYMTPVDPSPTTTPLTYAAEVWAEADDGKRYARRLASQRLVKLDGGELVTRRFTNEIVEQLSAAWVVATRLDEADLTEEFVVPREFAQQHEGYR